MSTTAIAALLFALACAALAWLWRRSRSSLAQAERHCAILREVIDAADAAFVLYDPDDRLVLASRSLIELYAGAGLDLSPGRRFEDILRQALAQGLIPEAEGCADEWLQQRLRLHREGGTASRRLVDGRWRRISEQRLSDGSVLGFSVDVTEQTRQQSALEAARAEAEREHQRLEDAIEALPDGFALYDRDDRLVIFNQRYRELYPLVAPAMRLGLTFEEILRYGLPRGQYPQAQGREEEFVSERMQRHLHPGQPVLQELPGNRWLRIDERRTRDGGIAGVRTDVTELVRREQALQRLNAQLDEANRQLGQLSETDALTGIANRRHFDRRLAEEWQRRRRQHHPLALLLLDVDHFKHYNDAHGHPRGDECLRRIATALQGCVRRASDVVARYGGEEFAVLLPYTAASDAQAMAQACIAAVDALAIEHGHSDVAPQVTVSIGVAVAVAVAGAEPAALVSAADGALYQAKAGGRHRLQMASPG